MPKNLNQQIFNLLNTINRSPDFSVYQSSKAFFPQLIIDGLGELALPLCDAQAKQLIKLCNQAPYGKGLQTIVDEAVRKVWELDASKISAGNQEWQQFITKTLRTCEEQLDLQGQTLIAHPYKLLVYEEGSFFLAHQDSEKEDDMVATLVMALPSAHQGGELTISHRGQSVSIDFSKEAQCYDFQSALFYADCHHEVSPVTSGYRLVLTYNICLKGKRKLSAFDFTKQQTALSKVISGWNSRLKEDDEKHLVISLDHQYSSDGFSLDALKGVDRSRADILLHSAQQAGCKAYLCLLEDYQMYQAWDKDELDELIEDYSSINQLIDMTGKQIDMRISRFNEDNILRQPGQDDEEAIEEDYEGYMGNYGNTLSRWYRHAAVIIWHQQYHLDILAHNNVDAAIAYLKQLHADKDANFQHDLMTLLMMADKGQCRSNDGNFTLLTLVLSQKNEAFAKLYSQHFLLTQDDLPSANKIQQIIELCGWDYLEKTVDTKEPAVRFQLLKILHKIKASLAWDQHPALEKLFYRALEESSLDNSWRSNAARNFKLIFPLCLEIPGEKSAVALANFLDKQGKRLSAENELLPYLEEQLVHKAKSDNAVIFDVAVDWLDKQFQTYRQQIEQEPEAAPVEVIPKIKCQCEDCKAIMHFMRSEKEKIELGRLKVRCEHLDSQIKLNNVQVIHSINKHRRPWRFIMQKLGADQRAKIAAYKVAKNYIKRLDKLT